MQMKRQLCGVIGQGRSQPIPHKAPGWAGARREAAAPLCQRSLQCSVRGPVRNGYQTLVMNLGPINHKESLLEGIFLLRVNKGSPENNHTFSPGKHPKVGNMKTHGPQAFCWVSSGHPGLHLLVTLCR